MRLITKLSTEQIVWFEAGNIQAKLHAGSCIVTYSIMPPPGPSYEKIWKVHDARYDNDQDSMVTGISTSSLQQFLP